MTRGFLSFLLILLGVVAMINTYGYAEDFKYEQYATEHPELNFSLEYISGWLHSEQSGSKNSFSQVVFYMPASEDQSAMANMVVTVEEDQNSGVNPLTLGVRVEDILSRRLKFKDAQVLSKEKKELLGLPAVEIKLSYKILDKLYSIDAKPLAVTERIIILKRQDRFYVLRYQNKTQDFHKFSPAFDHLVNSFKFKDK